MYSESGHMEHDTRLFFSHHFIRNHSTGKKINITGEKRKKKEKKKCVRNSKRHAACAKASRSVYSCEQPRCTDASTNAAVDGGPVSDYTASYELSTIEQTMAGETLAVIKLLSSPRCGRRDYNVCL